MLKPIHHFIQTFQFFLLPFPGLFLQADSFLLFFPVGRIISGVSNQLLPGNLINDFRAPVQKKAVMGHHYHRMLIRP